MIKPVIAILIVTVLASGKQPSGKTSDRAKEFRDSIPALPVNDTTPMVTGIGGIFFFSDSPKVAREWYARNLGIKASEYGTGFKSRNMERPEETEVLQWSLFKKGSKYFAPSKKDFMINYRVQNIEGLVRKLKINGAHILDSISTAEYGKFVHLLDPEGNKIELWEPVNHK